MTNRILKIFPEDIDLVYTKYAGKLYGFAYKYLKSKAETEEMVQSVFLKIWENHKTLRKESSFKSYLFTIAYNEICTNFKRRIHLKKFMDEQLIEKAIVTSDTDELVNYNSIKEQVDRIIDRLSERQRLIFLKSRQEGKTTKEIAQELGLSSGTVDNYISESLKFIRSNLQDKNFSLLLLFSLFWS